jgi:hypothetical protein
MIPTSLGLFHVELHANSVILHLGQTWMPTVTFSWGKGAENMHTVLDLVFARTFFTDYPRLLALYTGI